MRQKRKACLITGGAGFLGSQYCKFLAKKNKFIFSKSVFILIGTLTICKFLISCELCEMII